VYESSFDEMSYTGIGCNVCNIVNIFYALTARYLFGNSFSFSFYLRQFASYILNIAQFLYFIAYFTERLVDALVCVFKGVYLIKVRLHNVENMFMNLICPSNKEIQFQIVTAACYTNRDQKRGRR
jgi:hypothetical protein